MTAKNDLQPEYVYNSVSVIEALVVILSACRSLKLQESCHQTWIEITERNVNVGIGRGTFLEREWGADLQFKGQNFWKWLFWVTVNLSPLNEKFKPSIYKSILTLDGSKIRRVYDVAPKR